MTPHGRNPYGDEGVGNAQRDDLDRARERHASEAAARQAAEQATDAATWRHGFRASVRDLVGRLTRRR